jgi:hypothetical protein
MIGAVPEEKAMRGASRYDAIVATLVGFLALCASGYTAYMQRQQVRAAVSPILEFDSSNGPIRFRSGQNWMRDAAALRSRSVTAPHSVNAGPSQRRVDTDQNDRGLFGRVGDYFSIIRKVKRVQPQPEKSPWEQLTWPGFAKRTRGSGPTFIAPRS